ncbi:hypothetical protein HHK36_011731 [Tetracentron sinense]|uniref:Gnk2-homologous domain-containing protein n=1 Tax=Tetracentron sinense TaxID=13715 RepID=A0A834ZJ58_TETSI|nr:hypothetical protein HHK36_011731 [Tetracentron sinense]
MASFRLLFFLSGILIHLGLTTQRHICSDTGDYSANSIYGTNLNNLLSSIPSLTTLKDGFYNTTAGKNGNKVYSLSLCRGDVSSADCRKCINTTSHEITKLCPTQKEAIIWYKVCMLRYSNRAIFSILEETPFYSLWNPNNNSNSGQFNMVLGDLMDGLVTRATSGASTGMFATGEANLKTSQGSIYGLVQCTPDISQRDCEVCLKGAVGQIQICCDDNKQGGVVLKPSCNMRYEVFRFYEPIVAGIPPPPIYGNGSNSSGFVVIIAVPTVITVILLWIICFIVRRRRTRRRRKEKVDA